MKLACVFVDVCHPDYDYWGGHHLPYVAVSVSRDTTFANLRAAIINELRAGAVVVDDSTPEQTCGSDEWYKAACEAVERDVRSIDPSIDYPFHYLDDVESAYAYFSFGRVSN